MTAAQLAALRETLARDRAARADGDRWARPVQLPVDDPLPDGREVLQYGGVWYAVPLSWCPPDDPVEGIEVLTEEQVAAALGGGVVGARVAAVGSALGSGDDATARAILSPARPGRTN